MTKRLTRLTTGTETMITKATTMVRLETVTGLKNSLALADGMMKNQVNGATTTQNTILTNPVRRKWLGMKN